MATIHRDDLSVPAQLFRAAIADVTPASAEAGAVRDAVLAWDGRMSPDSAGAACYSTAALGAGQDRRQPVWPRRDGEHDLMRAAGQRLGRQPALVGAARPAAIG